MSPTPQFSQLPVWRCQGSDQVTAAARRQADRAKPTRAVQRLGTLRAGGRAELEQDARIFSTRNRNFTLTKSGQAPAVEDSPSIQFRFVSRRPPWRVSPGRAANATIIFGLTLLPTLGIIGFGIDCYTALSNKERLDAAADAAARSAISAAQTYINTNAANQSDPALTTSALAAGKAQALKAFPLNAGTSLVAVPATPTVSVTRSRAPPSCRPTPSGRAR